MMEMLGREPVEEDIPVGMEDLTYESQLAFEIYSFFPESWEGMSGSYLGKNWSGINDIMNIYDLSKKEKLIILKLVRVIDSAISKDISERQKQHRKSNK